MTGVKKVYETARSKKVVFLTALLAALIAAVTENERRKFILPYGPVVERAIV